MTNPHVDLIADYCADWTETDKPWARWEMQSSTSGWLQMESHPTWCPNIEYRRKPTQEEIDLDAYLKWVGFLADCETAEGHFLRALGVDEDLCAAWKAALAWERNRVKDAAP